MVVGFSHSIDADPNRIEMFVPHYRTFLSLAYGLEQARSNVDVRILTRRWIKDQYDITEDMEKNIILRENVDDFCQILSDFDPLYVMFWNGADQQDMVFICRDQGRIPIFCELGWLPQSGNTVFDFFGVNAGSGLAAIGPLKRSCGDRVLDWRENYLASRKYDAPEEELSDLQENFIFIPLQMESDTNIIYHSSFKKMRDFVIRISQSLPNKILLIRPHPNQMDVELGDLPDNCIVTNAGSLYYWLRKSEAVIGINSTVLIEACAMYKPVCGFGDGIGRRKGIFITEGDDVPSDLSAIIQNTEINVEAINGFLEELVFRRQINYMDFSNVDRLKENHVLSHIA
ncbi:hypothetical protein [Azospirillum sp. A29]|uniref:capsular polysaccharide export protein, LipB/KpsS family n=1 Tax=Azospirillum sp. A29 TaxID=3160606 RepID=UPI00366EFBAC